MLVTSDSNLVKAQWALRYLPTPDFQADGVVLQVAVLRQCLRCLAAVTTYDDLIASEKQANLASNLRDAMVARMASVVAAPLVLEVDRLVFEPPPEVKGQLDLDDPTAPTSSANTARPPTGTAEPPSSQNNPPVQPTVETRLEPNEVYSLELKNQSLVTRDKRLLELDILVLWQIADPKKAKLLAGRHHGESMLEDSISSHVRNQVANTRFSEIIGTLGCALAPADHGGLPQGWVASLKRYGIRVTALLTPSLRMDPRAKSVTIERMVAEVERDQKRRKLRLSE